MGGRAGGGVDPDHSPPARGRDRHLAEEQARHLGDLGVLVLEGKGQVVEVPRALQHVVRPGGGGDRGAQRMVGGGSVWYGVRGLRRWETFPSPTTNLRD